MAKKSAAKKKASKQGKKAAAEPKKATAALPSAALVKSLASLVIEAQNKIGTHAGNISDAIRDAKTKGLHPQAFKLAVRVKQRASKDVKDAADFLKHFEHCLGALGVRGLIADQPELDMGEKIETPVQASKPKPVKAKRSPKVYSPEPTPLSAAGEAHLQALKDAPAAVKPN